MMGLTCISGCNWVDGTGMILQGLSALVTEAMRDAHGKSVAVRPELRPAPISAGCHRAVSSCSH